MSTVSSVTLEPGDIVLVRGRAFFSRLIRTFTRSKKELPTVVNHVGIMVTTEDIVESFSRTVQRKFWDTYPGKNEVYVVRKLALSEKQQKAIVEKAATYVGAKYGWLKIIAHGLDRLVFKNRYVMRRLAFIDNYPICSWVVAEAYFKAGIGFGVPSNVASPDDIWDWVIEKYPEQWSVVYQGGK